VSCCDREMDKQRIIWVYVAFGAVSGNLLNDIRYYNARSRCGHLKELNLIMHYMILFIY
jgi:hypothetical protein